MSHPGHVKIEARHGGEFSAHHGGLGGDDGEGGQHAEVGVVLVQELEVVGLFGGHADTQSVQNALDVGVAEGHFRKLLPYCIHLRGMGRS